MINRNWVSMVSMRNLNIKTHKKRRGGGGGGEIALFNGEDN
jgi:hypothetical protein